MDEAEPIKDGMPVVVVGQTFWDYARREADDSSLAAVTRYLAGVESPDLPTNLRILAEVLRCDGERVRDCITAKRQRERNWKAAQRARRQEALEALKRAAGGTDMSSVSTGQNGVLTKQQEGRKEVQQGKEEIVKEENELKLEPEPPKKPHKKPVDERNIIPPTEEMVRSYIASRGSKVNAERFMNYWTARGWEMRPRQKMKDWQAAVRTFELNGLEAPAGKHQPGWRKSEKGQRDGLEGV